MPKVKVYLAADHRGFALKEYLKEVLLRFGYEAIDMGAYAEVPEDDYPDIVTPAAQQVANDPGSFGIFICYSGHGEAIAANRVPGVRAAVFYGGPGEILTLARTDNNANVLTLGARFLTQEEATTAVSLFLSTSFSNAERHIRRILKIDGHA